MASVEELEALLLKERSEPSSTAGKKPVREPGTTPSEEAKVSAKQAVLSAGGLGSAPAELKKTPTTVIAPGLSVVPEGQGPFGSDLPAEKPRFYGTTASKAFAGAQGTGHQLATEVVAAQTYTGDYDGIHSEPVMRESQEPGTLEQIYRVLEPFDNFRRATWLAFYEGADLLPDTREGGIDPSMPIDEIWETADGTVVGDSFAWLTAKGMAGQMEETINMAFNPSLPDDAGFVGDVGVGDAVEWWKAAAGAEDSQPGTVTTTGGRLDGKGTDEVYEQLAANWYTALATGDLAEKAWDERDIEAYWFYGVGGGKGWEMLDAERAPHPRGVHILNSTITKDEALRLAEASNDPALRNMGYVLSSDVGREIIGAGFEITLDPLWLAGPAKGGSSVAAAGKTYTIGKPMMAAVGAMEKVPLGGAFRTVNELRQIVVKSVKGVVSTEEAVKARTVMTEAMELAEGRALLAVEEARLAKNALASKDGANAVTEAVTVVRGQMKIVQNYLDRAKEMNRMDEALRQQRTMERLQRDLVKVQGSATEATKFLRGYAQQEARLGKAFSGYADDIRRALSLGDSAGTTPKAVSSGLVSEKGTLAWHIPFGDSTRYVFKPGAGGALAKRVKLLAPDPVLKAGSKVTDMMAPFTKAGLQDEITQISKATGLQEADIVSQLSGAKQWALTAHITGHKIGKLPRWFLTELNRWFGNRFIQPLVVSTRLGIDSAQMGTRGAVIARMPGAGRWFANLRRADPEVWDNYQGAVTAYMNRLDGLEATMRVDMERMIGHAKLALSARKRLAKKNLPQVEQAILRLKKLQVPGNDEGRRALRALEERAEQLRRWKSSDYDVNDILIDAGAHIEQGSGVLVNYPELAPYVQLTRELMQKYATATQKERAVVANALTNMVRNAKGDPKMKALFEESLVNLMMSINETTARQQARIDAAHRSASVELARINAAKKLFYSVRRDRLVEVMEALQARAFAKPVHQIEMGAVHAIVREVFQDDPEAVRTVLKLTAIAMRDDNGARALLQMANVLDSTALSFEKVRVAAPGQMRTAKALRVAIAKYLDRLDEQAKALEKVFVEGLSGGKVAIGNRVISEGTPVDVVKAIFKEESFSQQARAKVLVGNAEWDAFSAWWGSQRAVGLTPSTSVPPNWLKAADAMDRSDLLWEAAESAEELTSAVGKASTVKKTKKLAERTGKAKPSKLAKAAQGIDEILEGADSASLQAAGFTRILGPTWESPQFPGVVLKTKPANAPEAAIGAKYSDIGTQSEPVLGGRALVSERVTPLHEIKPDRLKSLLVSNFGEKAGKAIGRLADNALAAAAGEPALVSFGVGADFGRLLRLRSADNPEEIKEILRGLSDAEADELVLLLSEMGESSLFRRLAAVSRKENLLPEDLFRLDNIGVDASGRFKMLDMDTAPEAFDYATAATRLGAAQARSPELIDRVFSLGRLAPEDSAAIVLKPAAGRVPGKTKVRARPPIQEEVPGSAGRDLALRLPAGIKAEALAEQASEARLMLAGLGAKGMLGQGSKMGALTERGIFAERMRRLVRDSPSDEVAVARLKEAIYQVMGTFGDPAIPKLSVLDSQVDALAKRLLPALKQGAPAEVAGTIKEGRATAKLAFEAARKRVKRLEQQDLEKAAELSKDLELLKEAAETSRQQIIETTPRLPATEKMKQERELMELPKDLAENKDWVALEKWESDLWKDFNEMTSGLDDRQKLMVAFSSLSELPQLLRPEMKKSIEALYPSAMGQRMGEVPTELEPLVQNMRRMLERYEDLYSKHGMNFMKKPEDMLRVWGVVGYVPHIATKESILAAGGAMEYVGALKAGHKTAASRGGVEGALSLKMDARKLRKIDGTIAEVNAMKRDASLVLTLDPMAVLGRYGQANKAISAKEFVLTMMRGGVIRAMRSQEGKSMAMVAAEADMVPLLSRRIRNLEDELLFTGDRNAWEGAGVQPEEVLRQFRKSKREQKERKSIFSTWLEEIPELGALNKVEDFFMELRAREYFEGYELSDVSRMRRLGMEWGDIATALNERAMKVDKAFGSTAKIDPLSLAKYFEPGEEAWRLYVPRVVDESMQHIFGASAFEKAVSDTKLYKVATALNTWWKTRVTVISLAFSTRNALSNTMSNFLDLGGGAMNPHTNTKAGLLTQLVMFAEKYGSIEEAARVLSSPLPKEMLAQLSPAQRAQLKARHLTSRNTFFWITEAWPRVLGEKSWVKHGIDLGDGLPRSLDEALNVMRENGVTSQAFTQMVDLSSTERHLLDGIRYGKSLWAGNVRAMSAIEDAVVVAWPALMTASGGLPLILGLPKRFGGEVVSRSVENQARITNFIGNLKRTGSVGTAAEHVQKFLFNYGDLTSAQKSIMRLIFPFFTWNQKNMLLQMDLMQTSPVLYSQFWRIFMEDAPRVVEAMNAEYTDETYVPPAPGTMREQVNQEAHRLHAVKIPVPFMDNTYITGFGLPQEAFVEKVGLIAGAIDPKNWEPGGPRAYENRRRRLRFLGEVHFLLRFMLESSFEHHSFYDRPINQLTNGRLVAQTTAPMGMFGAPGQMLQTYANSAMGLHIASTWDSKTQTYGPEPIVFGRANHMFGSAPWTRVVRDAAAMTDVYATSMASDPATARKLGLDGDYEEVPLWIRLADALSGIQVVQHDPALQDSLRYYRLRESVRENLEQRDAVRDYNTDYISRDPKK